MRIREDQGTSAAQVFLQQRRAYFPNAVILLRSPGNAKALAKLAPFTKFQTPMNGNATAYVCLDHACHAPTTDGTKMLALLTKQSSPGETAE